MAGVYKSSRVSRYENSAWQLWVGVATRHNCEGALRGRFYFLQASRKLHCHHATTPIGIRVVIAAICSVLTVTFSTVYTWSCAILPIMLMKCVVSWEYEFFR